MSDHYDNLVLDIEDHIKNLACRVRIEVARRFIKHEDIIIMYHESGDVNPLLFPERHLTGIGHINLLPDQCIIQSQISADQTYPLPGAIPVTIYY